MRRPVNANLIEPVFAFALRLPARGSGILARDLYQQLRSAIVEGRLKPASRLPSTRRAAAALGIARNTVATAYGYLVAEGYLQSRPGARATVTAIAASSAARSTQTPSRIPSPALSKWRSLNSIPVPRTGLPSRSFRLGIPEHRYFPHATWRRLVARALRRFARDPFSYPPSEGILMLREAIARHVAFTRAVACSARDIVVTSGAQQAFDLIARLLVTPGETKVAVEEPGYPPARAAFIAAGAKVVPVAVDDEGLRVDDLPSDVRIVSVTPSHQSPTGATLSLRRRAALLDFARRKRATIVEDDYDGEFRFDNRPLDALQMLDRGSSVFYVGTFSKSLFPSLRKGFIVAPGWARDNVVTIKQCADSNCDAVGQSALAAFIRDGHLARHVRRMTPIYAERRDALLSGLQEQLHEWFEPIPCTIGLHLAARIRTAGLASRVVSTVAQLMPGAQSTADYAMRPGAHTAIAFGYGVIDADEIRSAVTRLARALRKTA